MSQSKAKRIRKLATIAGIYKPDDAVAYKVIKHKKMVPYRDMDGVPQMAPVERQQFINTKTFALKALKRDVDSGKIKLPTLKQLHEMAAIQATKEVSNG